MGYNFNSIFPAFCKGNGGFTRPWKPPADNATLTPDMESAHSSNMPDNFQRDLGPQFRESGVLKSLLDIAWNQGAKLEGLKEWEISVDFSMLSEGLAKITLRTAQKELFNGSLDLEEGIFAREQLPQEILTHLRDAVGLSPFRSMLAPAAYHITPLIDPSKHYSKSLLDATKLHFAAHSHHLRPDIIEEATLECLNDGFKLLDHKWDKIFEEVWPRAQLNVAPRIGVSDPTRIVFAPNTHEFCARILSCLGKKVEGVPAPITIVTTDSEFHSFNRQVERLAENPLVNLIKVPVEPFDTFTTRFSKAVSAPNIDLVFFSQVFYNSGFVVKDLERIVNSVVSDETIVAVDGYHAFGAMPVDLSSVQQRIFYTAGGYKYAQYGEGGAFLYVPPNISLRPENTGWFAQFGKLSQAGLERVAYPKDGMLFAGSTLDPAALYRLNKVSEWMATNGLNDNNMHQYVKELQRHFIFELDRHNFTDLNRSNLMRAGNLNDQGNFLTFRLPNAEDLSKLLGQHDIVVDSRADRLRFGFGIYQTEHSIRRLFERLATIPKLAA